MITCILDLCAPGIEYLPGAAGAVALKAFANGAVFAEVAGSTPAILALHGWGRRAADFRTALDGLSYLAPDLPGFGATPAPPAAIGARGYASALEPLLDELGEGPVLVGHSFGGRIALCLAAAHPDLFGGLVLTGAPLLRRHPVRKPPLGYRIGRWAGGRRLLNEEALERLRQRYGSADYRAAQGVMRDVLVATINESYDEELSNLGRPVQLVWGENDAEVPLAVAHLIADRIQGAEVQVIPGVGHQVPLEAPDALRRSVEKMLIR